MCFSFPLYSYVQPQLNNCTSFYGLHWNWILWHPTWNPFASCSVAYSARSTIQPRQRLAPWIGPKSMGASCCDGDTHLHQGFGGNSLSPRVQCTHNPTLFGHFPKEKLSIWNHAFHLSRLTASWVGVYKTIQKNTTLQNHPSVLEYLSVVSWIISLEPVENAGTQAAFWCFLGRSVYLLDAMNFNRGSTTITSLDPGPFISFHWTHEQGEQPPTVDGTLPPPIWICPRVAMSVKRDEGNDGNIVAWLLSHGGYIWIHSDHIFYTRSPNLSPNPELSLTVL